jgi:hypothetical protein
MEKRVMQKTKIYGPAKNNILVQASKILPIISPFYGVNPSVSTMMDIQYSQ